MDVFKYQKQQTALQHYSASSTPEAIPPQGLPAGMKVRKGSVRFFDELSPSNESVAAGALMAYQEFT